MKKQLFCFVSISLLVAAANAKAQPIDDKTEAQMKTFWGEGLTKPAAKKGKKQWYYHMELTRDDTSKEAMLNLYSAPGDASETKDFLSSSTTKVEFPGKTMTVKAKGCSITFEKDKADFTRVTFAKNCKDISKDMNGSWEVSGGGAL